MFVWPVSLRGLLTRRVAVRRRPASPAVSNSIGNPEELLLAFGMLRRGIWSSRRRWPGQLGKRRVEQVRFLIRC